MGQNKPIERKIRAYIKANRIDIRERNIRWLKRGYKYMDKPINNCPFTQQESYCQYLFPEYKEQLKCKAECPCTHHEIGTKKVSSRIRMLLKDEDKA